MSTYRPNDKTLSHKELQNLQNGYGNGSYDIYWVDAKVIDELRPEKIE